MAALKAVSEAPRRRVPAKFIVGGLVIVAVVGWLVVTNIAGSSAYYLTVKELKAEGPSDHLRRVSGTIVGESIQWDARAVLLQFEIEDESGQLPVSYHGVMPDMFR